MNLLPPQPKTMEMPHGLATHHQTGHSLQNVLMPGQDAAKPQNTHHVSTVGDADSVPVASMAVLPPVTSFISSSLPSLFPLSGLNDFLVGIANLSQFSDVTSSAQSDLLPVNTPTPQQQSANPQFLPMSLTANGLFSPLNDFGNITPLDTVATKDCSIPQTSDCLSGFITAGGGTNLPSSKTPLPSLNTLLKSPYEQPIGNFPPSSHTVASSPESMAPVATISKVNDLKGVTGAPSYTMAFGDNPHTADIGSNNPNDFLTPFTQESNLALMDVTTNTQPYTQTIPPMPSVGMCSTNQQMAMGQNQNTVATSIADCDDLPLEFSQGMHHTLNNLDSVASTSTRTISDSIPNGILTTQSIRAPSSNPIPVATVTPMSHGTPTRPAFVAQNQFSSASLQSFTSAFGRSRDSGSDNRSNVHTQSLTQNAINVTDPNSCIEETRCFKCKFCSFISLEKAIVLGHITSTHKDRLSPGLESSTTDNSTTIVEMETPPTSLNNSCEKYFLCSKCQQEYATLQECRDHMAIDHQVNPNLISVTKSTSGTDALDGLYIPMDQGPQASPKKQLMQATANEPAGPTCQAEKDKATEQPKKKPAASKHGTKKKKHLSQSQKAWRKKIKREQGSYICEFKGCNIRFRILDNLEFHRKCHVSGSTSFACTECNKHCDRWSSMAGHLWRGHKIDMELYGCDQCSFRTYSLSMLENVHKVIHMSERPFLCDICGKGFKSNKQLLNHKVSHSDTAKVPSTQFFSCDICSRKFKIRRMLHLHMESVHHKMRPFVCTYCGYAAFNRSTLRIHLRQHTGEKPFACDMCDYRTSDHNSLRRHKMRHSGEKPYKCPHCSYACIQSSTFKKHLKKNHPSTDGDLLFSCNLCSFQTLKKETYSSHMAQHKQPHAIKAAATARVNKGASTMPSSSDHQSLLTESNQSTTLGLVEAMGLRMSPEPPQDDLSNLSTAQFILSNLDVLDQTDIN